MINMGTSVGNSFGAGYTNRTNAYGYGISGRGQEDRDKRAFGLTDEEKERRGIKDPDKEKERKGIKDPDKEKERRGIQDPKEAKDSDKSKESKGIKDPAKECQTCKNRKYKDGSDEMVSFKSPTHISPESAASAVRAHEQEHVSNAYSKAAAKNGKVIMASVSVHMGICPECGRTYVAGGTTHTQIKYYNEDNPYQKDLKSADRTKYSGMNLDYAV